MSTEATVEERPVETLEQTIARLADVIGHLNPKRWGKHDEIDRVAFELPSLPRMNVHTLAALTKHPLANEMVRVKCNHCPTTFECRRIVAPFVACDACIEKATHDEKMKLHQRYWEHVCPERFRKTDPKHKDFPLAVFKDLRKEDPKKSLFLYGPTGTCKTRVGMLLLQHHLVRDQRVGVLWPEKLRSLVQGFDNSTFDQYANYDVLLMDDVLLSACRESKLVDVVKQLIDVRMRHERPFIITSQIGQEDELKEGKEFGEAKSADLERIKAVLRRLREECKVVSFATAKPAEGETAF